MLTFCGYAASLKACTYLTASPTLSHFSKQIFLHLNIKAAGCCRSVPYNEGNSHMWLLSAWNIYFKLRCPINVKYIMIKDLEKIQYISVLILLYVKWKILDILGSIKYIITISCMCSLYYFNVAIENFKCTCDSPLWLLHFHWTALHRQIPSSVLFQVSIILC